jgi:uncharacterized repeat protein (TIGR01451 family)
MRTIRRVSLAPLALLGGIFACRAMAGEVPAGLAPEEWRQIRASMEASAYRAGPALRPGAPPAVAALNRAQGYDTTFTAGGIEITSRGAGDAWTMAVSVTGYGYEGEVRALPEAEPAVGRERVEYRRGRLTEWYVNGPRGLEQGFDIEEPEVRGRGPLVVEMAVGGGLRAAAERGEVAFRDETGAVVLRYTGLKAWDADQRPLPVRLEAAGAQVRLAVGVEDARFPVTIDPYFVREAQLIGRAEPLGVEFARLGEAVAISGDTAVIGAPGPQSDPGDEFMGGLAHVFVRTGTAWAEQIKLFPGDFRPGDRFGASVAISGDTVVVGAPGQRVGLTYSVGAAYVFVRSGGLWFMQQKLVPDGVASSAFGTAVAITGERVVVGAPRDSSAGPRAAGAAYVFVRQGATWIREQKLLASDPVEIAFFGGSVAASGDTAVIGAEYARDAGGSQTGAAYVFTRAGGAWAQQARLTDADGGTDSFGFAVSISDDTVAVGVPGDGPNEPPVGAIQVFVRSGTAWTLQQELTVSHTQATSSFGHSLTLQGDTLAGGINNAAYVFVRTGTVWSQRQRVDTFTSLRPLLALDGDTLMFADPAQSGPGPLMLVSAGAAFAFVRSGDTWTLQQRLAGSDGFIDGFGGSVAVSGDTVAVGTSGDDLTHGRDVGTVSVFVRAGTAWVEQQKIVAADAQPGDGLGRSVALSGDTLIAVNRAAAYVFVRTGTVWTQQQKLVPSDAPTAPDFGMAVAGEGDTVVVTVAGATTSGGTLAGAASVFVRSGTTWTEQQRLTASDGAGGDLLGRSVSLSGDTVVLGAPGVEGPPWFDAGAAYVFVRSGGVWTEQQKLAVSEASHFNAFGSAVSLAGDTLAVGAPGADAVHVYTRSATTWAPSQRLAPWDPSGYSAFGTSVAHFGDVLAVGDFADSAGDLASRGAAYLFTRTAAGWVPLQKLLVPHGWAGDSFGADMAMSPELLVVGAPYDDTLAGENAGSVHVHRLQDLATADLALALADAPDPVLPPQLLSYAVAVSNVGSGPVAGVVAVTQTLAPATTFVSAAGDGWSCGHAAGVVTCTRPGLAAGAAAPVITVTVAPQDEPQMITTRATVSAAELDPLPSNNVDVETTIVATSTADLEITKEDLGALPRWGQPFVWRITARNQGPDAVSGATVADTFPPGALAVRWTCIASGGAACPVAGNGNLNVPVSLPPGGSVVFTATAATVVAGTPSLVNTATIAPPVGVFDPVAANNRSTVTSAEAARFHALAPCRVVDTRAIASPLAANSTRAFTVAGTCQVPADARAAAVVLVAVNPGAAGNLRLYPMGTPAPLASMLNFALARTRANNGIVPLGVGGEINVRCDMPAGSTASTHFVMDVVGYFR